MTSLYAPDPEAAGTLLQPWDEAFLAQRDVGILVPINFHTVPLVLLRAACFSRNQYEDTSFQKCLSNLLAVGLRRFVIDVYWDALRGEWSLCPAEIPPLSNAGGSSTAPVPTYTVSSSSSPTSAGVVATASPAGLKRQDESSQPRSGLASSSRISSSVTSLASVSPSSGTSVVDSTTSASSASTPAPSSTTSTHAQALGEGSLLFQLGDYNCTSSMTLNYLTDILNDFFDETATTTSASFTYLLLNIHAASSWQHPREPAQQPSAGLLPQAAGNLLKNVMKGNLSDEMYTPSKLADQRAHVSDSWDNVGVENQPREGYYTVQTNANGVAFTENGWPDEVTVQFRDFYRLITIFGTVDPQMDAYDRTQDADTIFPSDTISFHTNVSFSSSGTLNTGCLFDSAAKSITSATNSSFAVATVPSTLSVPANPDLSSPIPYISNLTACGLSSLLNHTLANVTADVNPLPYAAFAHSYLWSWAPGEPANATEPSSSSATGNRCAAANPRAPYAGRWHAVDCDTALRVACQRTSSPYDWVISASPARYLSADTACASPYVFSVPHTPLENAHLLAAVSSSLPSSSTRDPEPILLNLNSVDVPGCWVTAINGTCPYQEAGDEDQTRIVVVPTIAAIIIFVCTAATFFIKCASNRREDKRGRRRRMVEGWEYEGVPS